MTTLFISDLHLDPSRPAVIQAFLTFIENQASKADALYILGDFFEAWIGDDDVNELNTTVISHLRQLTSAGTPVYLMHGNRDFLIGERFAEQSGCQLICDPTLIDLYGQKVLLMHGDSLCIDDIDYMAFRQQCRSPQWQAGMLAYSLEQRRALATQLREQSHQANSNKADDIMDVNQDEVIRVLQQHDTQILIHGHTHRPKIHDLMANKLPAKRIVLGDWDQYGWSLSFNAEGAYELKQFAIE
ncbi:MAG: UDP-2,3-diacylglucosamine diphosphatase [Spongiibacteraceae bacterium]